MLQLLGHDSSFQSLLMSFQERVGPSSGYGSTDSRLQETETSPGNSKPGVIIANATTIHTHSHTFVGTSMHKCIDTLQHTGFPQWQPTATLG